MDIKNQLRNLAPLLFGVLFSQLLLPMPGWALDPGKEVLQYSCRTWDRQSGLPVSTISAIAQTQDGYVWLGSSAGVVRFDGIEFKLIDLSHVADLQNGIVTSLFPAHDGGLWIGLENNSFGFYDGRSFSFRGKDSWGSGHECPFNR